MSRTNMNRLLHPLKLRELRALPARRPFSTPRRTTSTFPKWTSTPRPFPSTTNLTLIDQTQLIEEETLPTYEAHRYYPIQQAEILNERYQVLAKLGYGVTSTVWLGRDLIESTYVVLKVYISLQEKTNRELDIYTHLNSIKTPHPARRFIRKLLNHFFIAGPHGDGHVVLVHEVLGMSANELMKWLPRRAMSLSDMKPCIRQLLAVLDFLHNGAGVVHTVARITDLQLKNLLLPAPDEESLSRFKDKQIASLLPRKVLDDRIIYTSPFVFPPSDGLPFLCDFGEARRLPPEGSGQVLNEDIMPNPYRAPEVILKMNWDWRVDIWDVAVLAWDIVSPKTLINGHNADGIFDNRVHVAELVALLGPPHPEFRQRNEKVCSVFWDEDVTFVVVLGNWTNLAPIPYITLESITENRVSGTEEDKREFVRWLQMALQWKPEDRQSALELLYDEWILKGLKRRGRAGQS
ncbi:hypothetical protein ZTR_07267 [Talaromyces verruculosus]|nr:hypothetical protein ZTR_07267 [Talaromyces verruculosus]